MKFLFFLAHALLVAVLERDDLVGALAGVLDLLPGLLLFLAQQGNTVCQQVSIVFDPTPIKNCG